jgi:hypothetical protein
MAGSAQESRSLTPVSRPTIKPTPRLSLLFYLGVLLTAEVLLTVCLRNLGWDSTSQLLPCTCLPSSTWQQQGAWGLAEAL